MRFWWVNHNQTAQQELDGGYLWSPKRESSGARSQFYDNMRLAVPGDAVLSFTRGQIGHLGVVLDFASPAMKPVAFGTAGENWSNDGWLLPVAWQSLPRPVRPKDHIAELGPMLPTKYSPIHPLSGNGNQKAYLAEIGRPAFDLLVDPASRPAMGTAPSTLEEHPLQRLDDLIEQRLAEDPGLDSTTKQQLILARHGQGIFRARVAQIEKACRLTAIDNPRLLVAGHIKPWRLCNTAAERLDGANGLLLAPHVDRLFDRGLIGFEASGRVIISPRLDPLDLERLGLRDACTRSCGPFSDQQAAYLSFHAENVLMT